MKLRRMCGGGVRKAPLTKVRWSANTAGPRKKYVAAINDRLGVALVLHDPDNQWPRREPAVRRAARKGILLELRNRLDDRASLIVCGFLGHQPDPIDPWCCLRCRCATGVG